VGTPGISPIWYRRQGIRQFVKFGIVGSTGLLVNLIIFTVLQRKTPFSPWLDFSIAFLTGALSNYYFNRRWTFRSEADARREGAQFLSVSVVALLIGDVIFWIGERAFVHRHQHTLWLLATGSGILWNFFANKYWTFRSR